MNRDMSDAVMGPTSPATSPPTSGNRSGGGTGGGPSNGSVGMTLLPETFLPGEFDVVCGRGKRAYNHIGNENFRIKVASMLEDYSKAKTKVDKSHVLNDVVAQIRSASPGGGFVKQDPKSGRWFEVGDFLAREKTSQAFRDCMQDSYKSSSAAKRKKRLEGQAKCTTKFSLDAGFEPGSFAGKKSSRAEQTNRVMFNSGNLEVLSRLQDSQSSLRNPMDLYSRDFGLDDSIRSLQSLGENLDRISSTAGNRRGMQSSSEIISRSRFPDRDQYYESKQRSYSLPSSPLTLPGMSETVEDVAGFHHSVPTMNFEPVTRNTIFPEQVYHSQPTAQNALHMSLPNMHFNTRQSNSRSDMAFMMNRSLPNIHFREDGGGTLLGDDPEDLDLEPLPFDSPLRSPARQHEFNRSVPRSLADQNFSLLEFEDSEPEIMISGGRMRGGSLFTNQSQPRGEEYDEGKMGADSSEEFMVKLSRITEPRLDKI